MILQVHPARGALANDGQRLHGRVKDSRGKGQGHQVPAALPADAVVFQHRQGAVVPLMRCQLHEHTTMSAPRTFYLWWACYVLNSTASLEADMASTHLSNTTLTPSLLHWVCGTDREHRPTSQQHLVNCCG